MAIIKTAPSCAYPTARWYFWSPSQPEKEKIEKEKYKIIYWTRLADYRNFATTAQKFDQKYKDLRSLIKSKSINDDTSTLLNSLLFAADIFGRNKKYPYDDELEWLFAMDPGELDLLFGSDFDISRVNMSNDALLVDDAVDYPSTMVYPIGSLLLSVFVMILAEKRPKKIVWVGLDPYATYSSVHGGNVYEIYVEVLKKLFLQNWMWSDFLEKFPNSDFFNNNDDLEKGRQNYFSFSPLKQVMRCSTNILDVYIKEMDTESMPIDLTPISGHNILGKVEIYPIDIEGKFSEAKIHIWEKVKEEIMQALYQGIPLNNIAILFGGGGMDEKAREFISQQLKESWLDMQCKTREANPIAAKKSKQKQNQDQDQIDYALLDRINILRWMDASSLEWMVVIGVTCFPKELFDLQKNQITYSHYRLMSRATSKLVIIKVIYGEDEIEQKEEDDDSDDDAAIKRALEEFKEINRVL